MTVYYVLAAIVMLGVMVMIHECGHFFAARLTGIPVKEFAIGFGPKVLSWKSRKHETQFFLRLIPAGGYCMFYGEDEVSGISREDPRNLNNFPAWKRMITIAMGPIMNFVLALVAATALFLAVGIATDGIVGRAVINTVSPGGAAEEAGMQAGDIILAVNGEAASGLTAEGQLPAVEMIGAYREGNPPLQLTLERDGQEITLSMTPRFNETEGRSLIGVELGYEYTPIYQPANLFQAIGAGANYCVRAGGAVLSGLRALFTTPDGFSQSAGPVGIIRLIAEETQKSGWTVYVQLLVMISVNLGLFNLIPIPGLDGSRLVFLLIEAIRRKPVPQKVESYVHLAGYVLLMGLMLLMTCKDILNLFQ